MAKKTTRGGSKKRVGDAEVITRLKGVAETVVTAANRGKDPHFNIPVRALSNVNFNKRRGIIEMGKTTQGRNFFSMNMARKFMQTVLIARWCKELRDEKKTTSIRDLYYMAKHTIADSKTNTLDDQKESDTVARAK